MPLNSGSPESLYSELLTFYASAYVTKQLAILHKVKLVSALHCDCTFRTSMMLPFRHILLFVEH